MSPVEKPTQEAVDFFVATVIEKLEAELADAAPEFQGRAERIREATEANIREMIGGTLSLDEAKANAKKLVSALEDELLVAAYEAKARTTKLVGELLQVALQIAATFV